MNEVKRCAKIGDWVKVVKKHSLEGSVPDDVGSLDFTVGDIFQVKKIYSRYRGIITFPYWLVFSEYVVLDGYLPLKIIGTAGEDLKAGDMLTADTNGHYVKYRPEKRKWTDEQIEEAKNIIISETTGCLTQLITTRSETDGIKGKKTTATMYVLLANGTYWVRRESITYCSMNDEYNYYIGCMVAILKVVDRPLPEWVK